MKKNGFVFMETLVVVSVLSFTLLMLFGTYSYILRKSRERNVFDTTEMIYKTYYTKEILTREFGDINTFISSSICKKRNFENNNGYSYICDLSINNSGNRLSQLRDAFEVEKIYFLTPSELINNGSKKDWLVFDATTIDYVKHLGKLNDKRRMIVKYKKVYQDGTYEVMHSSMEV